LKKCLYVPILNALSLDDCGSAAKTETTFFVAARTIGSHERRFVMSEKSMSHTTNTGKPRRHSRNSFNLGIRGFPRQIYVMVAMGFALSIGRNLAFPYLTLYLDGGTAGGALGFDFAFIGFLGMIGGFSYMLALPVTGSLCDKLGRRRMMAVFLLPQVILIPVYAFARTQFDFILLQVSTNALGAFYDPSFGAMVADLVEPLRREEVFGLTYMINNIATVVGPPIGGMIADSNGYPILFIYATLFIALGAGIFSLFIKESLPKGIKNQCQPKGDEEQNAPRYRDVLRNRVFILFCFMAALTLVVYSRMTDLLPVYTGDVGLKGVDWGFLLALNGAMVVCLQIPIRKFTMRIGPTRAFIMAQLLITSGFSYILFANDFTQLMFADAIFTLGEITFFPASSGFVANIAPQDMRGRYMSISNLFYATGSAVGGFLIFTIYGLLVVPKLIWGILGLIGFATLPGYLVLSRSFRKRKRVP
jgi:MFS family permease